MRFGLHYVNFSDPLRTRYAKASAGWYQKYIDTLGSNYTGTERVIVPAHRPIRPPILGNLPDQLADDDSIRMSSSWPLSYRFSVRENIQVFWKRILYCSRSMSSASCSWWETILGSYLSQTILQSNWFHGDLL